jgi:mannosyltransferase OCH1-like enzyme
MPDEFVNNGEKWQELNPGWRVILWSKPSFPIMNECLYKKANVYAPKDQLRFRADLLRLEILYAYGGLYVDADTKPLRPIGDMLDRYRAAAAYSPNAWKGKRILSNAFMWSTPEHEWVRRCILKMRLSVQTYQGAFLAMMTGPHHVTRCLKPGDDVHFLPTEFIYPTTREHVKTAFTFHAWANKTHLKMEALA